MIVGTAGHIDHGKSALVRALTGTDPDRLKEEQERGITIDLGFAHAPLPGGGVASFVDVPGHERFVRNMLAGAHGIDAVALVIAADESVMPQTREHFHICRLLEIPSGVIALTKCDVADADSQALAELEARELVAGSFLDGAELVRVSARTGQGLPELLAALGRLADRLGPRHAGGILRLPIDRAFSMRGFGTVVTGTLVSGTLAPGEELELLPPGLRVRVRGLHVHGAPAESIGAGQRAAVNLSGADLRSLERGQVLTRPGSLPVSSLLDAVVTLLPGVRPLRDGARVRVHLASAEALARVRALGGAEVLPGGSGMAQLRLERPAVATKGDRLILRSYSPAETIGGARVLDPQAPRRRRGQAAVGALEALAAAGVAEALDLFLEEAGARGASVASLASRVGLVASEAEAALRGNARAVLLAREPPVALHRAALQGIEDAALQALSGFHRQQPLRSGMPLEELRRRVFGAAPPGAAEHVLAGLVAQGRVRLEPDQVALAGHSVTLTAGEDQARRLASQALEAAGLAGLSLRELAERTRQEPKLVERVARLLVAEGQAARVGEGQLVARPSLDALKVHVRTRWPPGSRLDVAAFKEMTGLTRKHVIPLLEYLDRERVTRRSGDERLVLVESR